MCGRFTLTQPGTAIAQAFELTDVPDLVPRYNIAPTQPVPVVLRSSASQERQFRLLYWGLIPSWATDASVGVRMINARAETAAEKPSFRAAFKQRRCLVIADGFYEWQPLDTKAVTPKKQSPKKQPFYFHLQSHRPFAFAGLWEIWHSGNGDSIQSCTILTTTANATLAPIHDRMPVILPPASYDRWLDPDIRSVQSLLQPYPPEDMIAYPVGTQVNNARYDQPDCLQPLVATP